VGDSVRLRAVAYDSAGRPLPNVTIAFFPASIEGKVDSTGMVTGGAPGTFRVVAMPLAAGGRPGQPTEVLVRVLPAPAARVEVSGLPPRLAVGQRLALDAQVYAANGDRRADDAVQWTSSAPAVLQVGADGRVAALAPGRATLTARTGSVTATVPVTVVAAAVRRLEITGGAGSARTGDVLRFRAVPRDAAGGEVAGLTPQWSLSPGEGLVDQDGTFVPYAAGTYTLTAALGAASAQAVVRVRPREVQRAATILGRVPLKLPTAEFWPHPDGKHAYLSTIGDRVYALDVSDRANPRITDSVVVDARIVNDVMTTADGKYGVLTREGASGRRNGIVVLSFEDPAHPKAIGDYTETVTGGVHSAFVYTQPKHGTHVYLTDDATGSLRVIDLNDPRAPREIARWQTPRPAGRYVHDVDVRDGLAYLSYWNDGLVILDVGNGIRGGAPASPKLVSSLRYDLDSLYRTVEVEGGSGYIRGTHTAWRHGDYVFVGDEVFSARPLGIQMPDRALGKANGRLHVIDVRDVTRPREVAWFEPKDGGTHNVWVAGDTLYLGDYQGGLRVLDISGELRGDLLAQGREIAHVHTGDAKGLVPNAAMAWGAFYQNGTIWVNDIFSGLWSVKLEPKAEPRIVP
jgi:hypothetical protein